MEPDDQTEALLARLRDAATFEQQVEVVQALVKAKRVAKLAEAQPFKNVVSALGAHAQSGDPTGRLLSVASLELLRVVAKQKSTQIGTILKASLEPELPSITVLSDGDQRYYVASAIEHVRPPWTTIYAAREAVAETTAEIARTKLVEALVGEASSVERALGNLASNVAVIRSTEKQADTNGRTARRVLDAVRQAVVNHNPPPGDHVGEALRDFVVAIMAVKGPPDDPKVMNELTEAVAQTIVALVRARFSLMMDRGLYSALSTCKRSYLASSWNANVERSRGMLEVRRILLDAIRLSARLGVRDEGLLNALDVVRGTRERSLQDLREIVREAGGLTPEVQHWLSTGRMNGGSQTDISSETTQVLESDKALAHGMLIAAEASMGDATTTERLAKVILEIGQRRSMALFGDPGSVVSFSPSEHMLLQGEAESSTVRIVSPGVMRRDTAGTTHVLIKAIVSTK